LLQYKKVPFRTVWVSYPDIKQAVGHTQPGAQVVTLPVIRHGDTWVADSWNIAQYLDKHFPSPPLVVPSLESVWFFQSYLSSILMPTIAPLVLPRIPSILNETDKQFFIRTWEEKLVGKIGVYGKKATIEHIRQPLTPIVRSLERYGPYLGGKDLSYSDLILLGAFQWFQTVNFDGLRSTLRLHESSDGSKPLLEWYNRVKPLAVVQEEAS